jgi:hypothetical protein
MTPHRVQLSRKKGWKMPPNTVKVDRTTQYGNRYVVGGNPCLHVDGALHEVPDAETSVRLHREELEHWMMRRPEQVRVMLEPLRGKNLACWCKPGAPCHADALLMMSNV